MRSLVSALSSLILAGCASNTLLSEVTTAMFRQQMGMATDATVNAPLNPAYRYLKVDVLGQSSALLVLGYVDAHAQGDIKVWYSAKGEVLKTQKGRIVGTAGLEVDWLSVRFPSAPPDWSQVMQQATTYTRVRDERPGYRYSVTEQIKIQAVSDKPNIPLPSTLPMNTAIHYEWVRESQMTSTAQAIPPSWYALVTKKNKRHLVYSYQCLSAQLCLSLQPWPVEKAPV